MLVSHNLIFNSCFIHSLKTPIPSRSLNYYFLELIILESISVPHLSS